MDRPCVSLPPPAIGLLANRELGSSLRPSPGPVMDVTSVDDEDTTFICAISSGNITRTGLCSTPCSTQRGRGPFVPVAMNSCSVAKELSDMDRRGAPTRSLFSTSRVDFLIAHTVVSDRMNTKSAWAAKSRTDESSEGKELIRSLACASHKITDPSVAPLHTSTPTRRMQDTAAACAGTAGDFLIRFSLSRNCREPSEKPHHMQCMTGSPQVASVARRMSPVLSRDSVSKRPIVLPNPTHRFDSSTDSQRTLSFCFFKAPFSWKSFLFQQCTTPSLLLLQSQSSSPT
mmetsp:Transcript_27395/g.68771  ORF Transcript_27395/g.68771 Transcript_27395/m.68771 type:complete len:287 (-) Transcript_27395:671-1531(-)